MSDQRLWSPERLAGLLEGHPLNRDTLAAVLATVLFWERGMAWPEDDPWSKPEFQALEREADAAAALLFSEEAFMDKLWERRRQLERALEG